MSNSADEKLKCFKKLLNNRANNGLTVCTLNSDRLYIYCLSRQFNSTVDMSTLLSSIESEISEKVASLPPLE